MKTYNNAGMGLMIARIAAVTVLVIYFVIIAYGWISGNNLPDAAVRFLGIIDLIALPTAVFSAMRLRMIRKQKNG